MKKLLLILIMVIPFISFSQENEKTTKSEKILESKHKLIRYYYTCESIAYELYSVNGNEKTTKKRIKYNSKSYELLKLGEKFYNKAANEYLTLQELTDFKLSEKVRENINLFNKYYSEIFTEQYLKNVDGRKALVLVYLYELRLREFEKDFIEKNLMQDDEK